MKSQCNVDDSVLNINSNCLVVQIDFLERQRGDRSKPDKATMSLVESPRALNLEISLFKLEVGGGMLLLAAAWLAVLASLLPSFTSQLGPPSYKTKM